MSERRIVPVGVRPRRARGLRISPTPLGEFGEFKPIFIEQTNKMPWSIFGRVVVETSGGHRIIGSGTLISSRHVLTAAHCLWNQGGKANRIWFYPGYHRKNGLDITPHGVLEGSGEYKMPELYSPSTNSSRSDFAVFALKDTAPSDIKPPRLHYISSNSVLANTSINICGIPNEVGPEIPFWVVTGKLKPLFINDRTFRHQLDTRPGMSGAGVCIQSNGQILIIGVHLELASKTNRAVRMTDVTIKTIRAWMTMI